MRSLYRLGLVALGVLLLLGLVQAPLVHAGASLVVNSLMVTGNGRV